MNTYSRRMPLRVLPVALAALSAAALIVALLNRRNVPEPKWTSYPPFDGRPDAFHSLHILDARVWLGVSIAFGIAALIAFLAAQAQRRRDAA